MAPILMNLMGFSCTSSKPLEKPANNSGSELRVNTVNTVNKLYLDLDGNVVSVDLFVIHAGLRG